MTTFFKNLANNVKTNVKSQIAGPRHDGFVKAQEDNLFTKTDPEIDGEECLHDCEGCTIRYPRKWSIDEESKMYGFVDAWSTHLIVATGKADWVRDVADEKGSVMEAVENCKGQPTNGKMKLSASNMPMPNHATDHSEGTTVLLLPAFTYVDNVTPTSVPDLLSSVVSNSPTNITPLSPIPVSYPDPLPSDLRLRACNHTALILLCSQGTRDARCGQSAPLLKRELERHLRPLGLYRDLDDNRPGGVGIYFISHVGGHKFSANMLIYRRADAGRDVVTVHDTDGDSKAETATNGVETNGVGKSTTGGLGEASQCIWLARVRPEDCENIVRYTVGQGKVLKPGTQLRGGFDRERQLTSW
ncbi:hypothetical protein K461DRAFT_277012 [Myriangium duriaei CBS 260.36]|uniref:Actin patches distal protein 1 n=1 Tax=Myriangium duriaei CBS 260.36 TaxID=1168546 RepID=A0A9P4J7P4_9PEZI|nr:hypothetical protein K461DRAFT_277012 [Myriangium duriaei CBS 260.36]